MVGCRDNHKEVPMHKVKLPIVAVLGVVIAGVCVTTFAAARGKSAVQTWEYHCVLPPGAIPMPEDRVPSAHEKALHDGPAHPAENVLNHLGTKGWELVAIDPNNGHYCFKRRPG